MTLKAFHVLFITLSIVLAIGFGMWAVVSYAESGALEHLVLAVLSFAGGAALVMWERNFLRRGQS